MSETDKTLLQLLDDAVAHLEDRHFTFTDEEALASVWENGYDMGPQEDPLARFVLAAEAEKNYRRQWRLQTQTLANNRLLDALLAGAWHGREIEAELRHLSVEDQVHYIFCPHDARFSTLADGTLEPADRERPVALASATQADLDTLAPTLWQYWKEDGVHPLTIRHIAELLGRLGWAGANERNAWTVARAWLLTRPEVVRAGQDYWILATTVPQEPARTRLHVLPMTTTQSQLEEGSASDTKSPALPDAPGDSATTSSHRSRVHTIDEQQIVQRNVPVTSSVSWHQPLRTVHLLEGFLLVPAQARSAYPPRAVGAGDIQVVPGLWFESGDRLWLWLDRQHDRLYGPDLAHQLEWLEAGDILHIIWRPDAITLDKAGHDDEVQREESRLVDLEELKALRGGLGESYRQSLQIILSSAPEGLTFLQVVVALRERQGHIVHHGTIRALLYTGGFIHRQHLWFAAPDTPSPHANSAPLSSKPSNRTNQPIRMVKQ